jgi:hypothetical protein
VEVVDLDEDEDEENMDVDGGHNSEEEEEAEGDGEDDEGLERETIPPDLLTRILYEFFEREDTRITKDANAAVAKYVDVFVREAIARAAAERGRDGSFLEVSSFLFCFEFICSALSKTGLGWPANLVGRSRNWKRLRRSC